MDIASTRAYPGESQRSAVSWGAIVAGAAAAAVLSLVMVILGSGLGLAVISPWSYHSTAAIGISTILWISLTQLAASAVGGYMAGRLRTPWVSVHSDEVYFRDTAHGLLAWAVATLLTAILVSGAARSLFDGAVEAGTEVAKVSAVGGVREAIDSGLNPVDYFADMLLRSETAPAEAGNARPEVMRIFATALQAGSLSPMDRTYLARMVAARTALPQSEAEQRVDAVYAKVSATVANAKVKAKEAANTARKATAGAAIWMTVALLLGGFVASLSATFGGRLRDAATQSTTHIR
ncbi:MAG: hypothetical protein ACEQSK_12070 [Sphingomonadaceae bacterium]